MTQDMTQDVVQAHAMRVSSAGEGASVLRQRLSEDGYLYLPGLLSEERARSLGNRILEAVAPHGWLAAGSDPADGLPGQRPRTFEDDDWWDAYRDIQRLEEFHALAHDPALLSLMGLLVGDTPVCHPGKVARLTFPGADYPSPPHQDHLHIGGTIDVITSWIPLCDIPPELGGLHVHPGSHALGLLDTHEAVGAGKVAIDPLPGAAPAVTANYRAGDAVAFHSLMVHHAPVNRGARMRVSADFRYQAVSDPINPQVLFPHGYGGGVMPHWLELIEGWESTEWVDLPETLRFDSWAERMSRSVRTRFLSAAGS